ncbi:hypothetical protein TVAG_240160 [Trichomonas vaginalis G3]|uniref:Uncharacterized protein n=1 Tax=Trichomonas vaginalis (strain ATCC PRA-98 / G3) TaxID=412133 RepID=A2EFF8_TRIV3|nr:TOR signaling [Trichomonas vaginalis G3]EAY08655.1 hypothetical protein TVAG_240160 [Trichomonas vaginalis G3]KAI5543858.1 TOR signaling [Trichomonas vaginalis G3]|eukprot:XP_001320878.1 hypothetical protein [Trichomonas vaginalis G3]
MDDEFNLKSYMDSLIDQESSAAWKPFPERYVNTRPQKEIIIPQISLTQKPVHVFCKITDDFTTMQQYSLDEDSLPPKVLCWNDLSALDIKMATKTVKAGVEHEYKYLIDDLSIEFESVSNGNEDPLPIEATNPDSQLIYHVLDPTLSKSSRITPAPKVDTQQVQKMKLSKSASQLKYMTDSNTKTPIVIQTTQQPPIQQDAPNIRKLCEQIPKDTIFILDCSFADDCLKTIIEKRRDLTVFAATQESLLYNPQLPCDLFTSCLLTPAKVAILWQSQSYSDIHSGLLSEIDIQSLIDILNDSPVSSEILKLLENALEAYVDQMAFETLAEDQPLFYKIFRKDTLTARLFANFVFAVRMMKTVSTLPTSYPELPDMSQHDLWDSFYLQVDRALYSLKEAMLPKPRNVFSINELLEEQLNCLESWLWFPKKNRDAPMELPFMLYLLNSPNHFKKAVYFCSNFLGISPDTTIQFLNTRCFPLLPQLLENTTLLKNCDADTLAHFTFIIVNCVLLSPSLSKSFENRISFWIEHVRSTNESLCAASLSILLLYAESPGKIDLFKSNELDKLFEQYSSHKNHNIRTLAHLLLTKMGIGLEQPLDVIQNEPSPQCRAAIVSRITTTIGTDKCSSELRGALIYDLILLVNDPYPLVREEALVALSHSLNKDSTELLNSLKTYITDFRDDKAKNPIVTLLGHELQILMFEPSKRVNERLNEFLVYLAQRFIDSKNAQPLQSNLSRFCVSDISHPSHSNLNPLTFSSNAMVVNEINLEGRPSISPSGLLSCADQTGQLHCQVTIQGQTSKQIFDYFKPGLETDKIPPYFGHLAETRRTMKTTIDYQAFIDDSRMLAISNRSQVAIINFNKSKDAECAFWMAPPDSCNKVVVDYNDKAFQILHSSGSSLVHIYDIESQKKLDNIKVPRSQTNGMQWLKPFTSLFYVSQEHFTLYDSRMRGSIALIKDGGLDFLGANCSASMPNALVMATKYGHIKMFDIRVMQMISQRELVMPLKQFEVHRQLPYAVGLTNNSLYSISFEDYELTTEAQDNMVIPDAFGLHMSESTCAIRTGNTVKTCVIYY